MTIMNEEALYERILSIITTLTGYREDVYVSEVQNNLIDQGVVLPPVVIDVVMRKLLAANRIAINSHGGLIVIPPDETDNKAFDMPQVLFGKPVVYTDTIDFAKNTSPIVLGDMRREDYSIPVRVELDVVPDGNGGFKATAANPDEAYLLDRIIADIQNEADNTSD